MQIYVVFTTLPAVFEEKGLSSLIDNPFEEILIG